MFSIERFELVHWDWWERFSVPLDAAIVTIVGPNGSGKTTLLDALRTALGIDCSAGRDYKRYVRRADRPYAWLRMVVSNNKRPNGQFAFWPLTSEKVTLFCRIRKKGGDWQRDYGIGAGEVGIEGAETPEAVTWVGVRQYAAQLESAGLTRAIKRVLALDQGHTDKLCEYSGRELLSLVFDVFGDQEVLDNYDQARKEQAAVGRELEELRTMLASLHTRLLAAEADVNSYNDHQRLLGELAELEGQWLPRTRLAEQMDTLRGGRSLLTGRRRESRELIERERQTREAVQSLSAELAEVETRESRAKEDYEQVSLLLNKLSKPLGRAELVLEQQKRLQERLQTGKQGFDPQQAVDEAERLRRKVYELERRAGELKLRRSELDEQRQALEAGRRPQPPEVAAFRAALNNAGIAHRGLAEILEITEAEWQPAVEAVLAGLRHLVLLDQPADKARAWALGEQLRYRHFVVPERAAVPPASRGSLLECVRFTAPAPPWLARLLDGIQRVESVEAGARLPESQAWITASGYHRERRGARDIRVADRHFGSGLLADVQRERAAVERELAEVQEEARGHAERLSRVQGRLAGLDAAQELSARASEFAQAAETFQQLDTDRQALESRRASLAPAWHEASTRKEALIKSLTLAESAAEQAQRRLASLGAELLAARRGYVEAVLAFRSLRAGKPRGWWRDSGLAETRARFKSSEVVELEIERLDRRRKESQFHTDANCLLIRDKLRADHRQLEERIELQGAHLERAQTATDRARAQYIGVLRGTLRRYAHNLKLLGGLAGIGVDVGFPSLSNDDLALTQATLDVRFDFDQKGLIGLNDGEASGGQQVMKSMILLVGLLMEDDVSGGFVFIDEPFAHLDIFNIDKVGTFLQATRAQYIVTTPNTHNVNVFKPSELTLLTQKKRSGEGYAPPVAFLRRSRSLAQAPRAEARGA